MTQKIYQKTLIIGLGLIGGSFAKALKKRDLVSQIQAFDPDVEALDLAKAEGVIDSGFFDLQFLSDELKDFDLIVIATPLSVYEEIFEELSKEISANCTIIDLGSLKNFIKEILPKNLQKNFVGCHPIAGSEKTGFENSSAELFSGKKFIICNRNAQVEKLAAAIGCKVEFLDTAKHDEIYALVSHLPQFLSFLTKEFSPKKLADEELKKAFRLDDSDPEIWEDIFDLNADNLEKFYVEFYDNLEKLIEAPSSALSGGAGICPEEEFAEIFFRYLVVRAYLEIPEVKLWQNYAGSGFKDFTSIISLLNCEPQKLQKLIAQNQKKIRKFFDSIS